MGNQKESKGAAEKTGKHKNARAFIECAMIWESWHLTDCSGGQGCGFNQPQQTLLVTQMQSNFKCCHGGTIFLALQNIYRIIQEKKSFSILFLLLKVLIRLTKESCTSI